MYMYMCMYIASYHIQTIPCFSNVVHEKYMGHMYIHTCTLNFSQVGVFFLLLRPTFPDHQVCTAHPTTSVAARGRGLHEDCPIQFLL